MNGLRLGAALLMIARVAAGLDELWHCDTWAAARSLPAVADYDGDGKVEVVFTTRYDGVVWVAGADGAVLRRDDHDYWLEGGIAAVVQPKARAAVFAFQESAGRLNVCNYAGGTTLWVQLDGSACIGTAPCFADLDGDGVYEVVTAQQDGTVFALSGALIPQWRYDAGAPLDSSPAVIPGASGSTLYVLAVDGTLHAVSGQGEPLWRFQMVHKAARFPSISDPLAVMLAGDHPSVLISDSAGWLYAVNAATGEEEWRREAGSRCLGTPAVADVDASAGKEIVAVDETGRIAVLSAQGRPLREAQLPEGGYVPRPLVADVNGDGEPELLLATDHWTAIAAGLDGSVREVMPLQGNALEGLVLEDVNGDGRLDLLAATECARLHCFATSALAGAGNWTHPRGGFAMAGCPRPIVPPTRAAPPGEQRRPGPPLTVVVSDYEKGAPWATAVVTHDGPPKASHVAAVIRCNGKVVGAAVKPCEWPRFTVPFVQMTQGSFALDVTWYGKDGTPLRSASAVLAAPQGSQVVELAATDAFDAALRERAEAYRAPAAWRVPQVCGRDSWHVARYMPGQWETYGLAHEAFIEEAVPRLWAPAREPFGPDHQAWPFFASDRKPFFVMNDYFRPEAAYSADPYAAITAMAGERFLGFPVHEWAYGAWKSKLEKADPPPATREEATAMLKSEFDTLLDLCHGQMYEGEGYCLFHHQAFEWGAPMGYAEIGENIPCAPLQFAFLRGASRQYGGRPWGAYLSNWFRGVVADTRFHGENAPLVWQPENYTDGPDCGHSPNLESRLEMAAHLSGATFVHHESDGHNGSIFAQEPRPDEYELSLFGAAMQRWYAYARAYPDRGVAYTPVAFLVDFNHGWRPREDIYGIWAQQRADLAMENLFRHVYAWDGRLDFERGYLTNGPYGDIFDVVTNHASLDVLRNYAVVWPSGPVVFDATRREALAAYVRGGGILVLDSAVASAFPRDLLGVRFRKNEQCAVGIQTALGGAANRTPYRFREMQPSRDAQVLAWTDAGTPLLAWRRYGEGIVIVSATHHWVDERDQLLPLAAAVLQSLATAFLPVQWSPGPEVLINRTSDAWIIGLINNTGIKKVPTLPAAADSTGTRDCLLQFEGRVPLRFTSRLGDFRWNVRENGLQTRLTPGAVAVAEVHFAE